MAKTGLNGAMKWIITVAGVLIAVGALYKTVNDMEPEVEANTEHRIRFEEKVSTMETNISRILNILEDER